MYSPTMKSFFATRTLKIGSVGERGRHRRIGAANQRAFGVQHPDVCVGLSELGHDPPEIRGATFTVAFANISAVGDGHQELTGTLDEALLLKRLEIRQPLGVLRNGALSLLPPIEADVKEKGDGWDGDEGGRGENTQS